MAALRDGGCQSRPVLVTVNPVLQAAEVEYILKQGDVQALFFIARVRNKGIMLQAGVHFTPFSIPISEESPR